MTRPPHVMHVVLSLTPGGAERLVIDLCRRTAPDMPVSICCLDDRGAWAEQAEDAGIPVGVLGRQPGFHPGLGLRLAAEAKRRGATVLHCHQYTPFVYGALAGLRRPSLRIVYTEHGRQSDAPPSPKRRLANEVLGRRADAIVAVSDELRHFMLAEGFDASAVRVIRNGIETGPVVGADDRAAARHRLGIPDAAFVVGTVARFDAVKRLDILVHACASLRERRQPAWLVLAGDGPERTALEAQAKELGLGAQVLFTGLRDDARSLLPALDVFVNTSVSEGVSVTLLEAMAASRPVVATRVGGTPEVIEDGRTGVLVPARDVEAVARAIERFARDGDARMTVGEAAREAVVTRFSAAAMTDAYRAIYRGAPRSS